VGGSKKSGFMALRRVWRLGDGQSYCRCPK